MKIIFAECKFKIIKKRIQMICIQKIKHRKSLKALSECYNMKNVSH